MEGEGREEKRREGKGREEKGREEKGIPVGHLPTANPVCLGHAPIFSVVKS